MSDAVESMVADDEAGAHIDESLFDNGTNYHEALGSIESDVHHPHQQSDTHRQPAAGATQVQPQQSRAPYQSFEDFLERADIDELDDLDASLRSVPLPPQAPRIDPVEAELQRQQAREQTDPSGNLPDTVTGTAPDAVGDGLAPTPPGGAADPDETQGKPQRERERVRVTNDQDREIVELARSQGLGIAAAAQLYFERQREANAAALDDLIDDTPDPAQPAAKQPTGPALSFETVADAEARIDDLEAEADTALLQYEYERVKELRDEARALRRQIPAIAQREQQAETERIESERAAYMTTWNASKAKAETLFPDVRNPESALTVEMTRLNEEAKTTDPALYGSPTKYFELASRAALNLAAKGIPFATPGSSMSAPSGQQQQPASVPARVPAARGVVSSPSARSTTPIPAATRFDERLDAVQTSEDLEELMQELR